MADEHDYISFGDGTGGDDDLVLNGGGSAGYTGGLYTVERATGLASLPTPRVTITQLAGAPGSVLSEADDGERIVTLEGELHAEDRLILQAELARFKYILSTQRGEQWLVWTPQGQTQRRIKAILQNSTDAVLDMEDDHTARFTLKFICASPYWEVTTQTIITGSIVASGQTIDLFNAGNVYAEPVIRITPTSAKGDGFAYRRWVAIYNRLSVALTNYPVEITSEAGVSGIDHAALVLAGKSLATGGDLQVLLDGEPVNRWLDGENTANCKIWTNITFQPGQAPQLVEAFGSGDSIASLSLTDTADLPSAGILYNTNTQEAFSYTANDTVLGKVLGVTRAIKTTSAAAAASGDIFQWIERDVWIVYGSGETTAWTTSKSPVLDLDTSHNTAWVYSIFGDSTPGADRSGQWVRFPVWGEPWFYELTHGAGQAGEWEELGCLVNATTYYGYSRMYLYNPVGILTASFTTGEKYIYNVGNWNSWIESSLDGSVWFTEYSIPAPSVADTWENWERNEIVQDNALYLGIVNGYDQAFDRLFPNVSDGGNIYVEVSQCTITLDGGNILGIDVMAEASVYSLDATLTLVDGGEDQEAIRLQFSMSVDETLEIDCRMAYRTITYLKDNSNQFQARTLQTPSLRNYWLKLMGHWNGGKTMQLRYDEATVIAVTVIVIYYSRYL